MTADAVGGVWTYALDLAAELGRREVKVTIAVMGPAPSPAQLADAGQIRSLDVRAAPFALEWMPAPWVDVARAGSWLLSLEQDVRPEVVHLNGYVHASLPWRAPVLVAAHSCVASWWEGVRQEPLPGDWRVYRTAVASGLRAADCVVAPSHAMRDALWRNYGEGADAAVIPNARRGGSRPAVAKEPFVFAAGRLWDEAKNIAALGAAAPACPWPVKVAGDDRDPQGGRGVLPNLTCLGRLSQDEVRGWMDRAAIYAFPAKYEPFGLSVLEAAQSACALVLGDIASLRENWDGAAVFVPPGDAAAIAQAITSLAGDPGAQARLGDAALQRARTFSPTRQVESYLRVYKGLAKRGRGHRLAITGAGETVPVQPRAAAKPARH